MVGLEGGPDRNYLHTNISNVPVATYTPVTGLQAGVVLQYRINNLLALETQPSFQQKGYKLEWTGYFSGIYQRDLNAYWCLPLIGDVSFAAGKFRFVIQAGAYAAYWSAGRVKGTMPNVADPTPATSNLNYLGYNTSYSYDVPYTFNPRSDERVELGVLTGGRIALEEKVFQLFLGISYYQSSTDQQKNYEINQVPRYNRIVLLAAGVLYHLKAFKL